MSISVNIDVDVDISDIDTEDLKDELERRGEFVSFDTGGVDVERIRHLMLCGLEDQAKTEAWDMITKTLRATA